MSAGVRALAAAALLSAGLGCASMNPPPGGPEDQGPPQVVSASPDSAAVNFRGRSIVFRFDEVVSNRGPEGELERFVLLSPIDGEPRVSWKRDAIEVRPRRGWRPNTTYTVTLLPGLADLRGNRTTETRTLVFSTGAEIATQTIVGRVFDWQAERVATNALVEARSRADSTLYVASTDSAGAFSVGPLPGGAYHVRAFADANRNRAPDRGEGWDTTQVLVQTQRASVDLYIAPRDSIPPRVLAATLVDSLHLAVEFDRAVDPATPLTPANFRLRRADSSEVRITAVQTKKDHDRAIEEERRRADSVTAARDTTARRDTAAARRDTTPARPARPPAAGPPRPSRPAPPTAFVLTVAEPLPRGASYRIAITGVRSLTGIARDSDRSFTVPAAPAAAPAPPDSARRPPARTSPR